MILRRICVEGYDTSLPVNAVKDALMRHFASCGNIPHIFVPKDPRSDVINRFSIIYLQGEGAEEKALKRSGSDVGGWNVVVKALPFPNDYTDPDMSPMSSADSGEIFPILVTGFDTSLSQDDVNSALWRHFSSCGEVMNVRYPVGALSRKALVYIEGEGAVERALELSGCGREVLNVVVVCVFHPQYTYFGELVADKRNCRGQETSDADMLKRGTIRRICVEGYDTSLADYVVKDALKKHFASCGNIPHVYVPKAVGSETLNRYAFIYIQGEGAEEKAVELSGSDVGGWKVVAKALPFQIDPEVAPMRVANSNDIFLVVVTGYDTSLPQGYVATVLKEHFSSCGEIWKVIISRDGGSGSGLGRLAYVYTEGDVAVEKALELSGCEVEGWTIDIVKVIPPYVQRSFVPLSNLPIGFSRPGKRKLTLAERFGNRRDGFFLSDEYEEVEGSTPAQE